MTLSSTLKPSPTGRSLPECPSTSGTGVALAYRAGPRRQWERAVKVKALSLLPSISLCRIKRPTYVPGCPRRCTRAARSCGRTSPAAGAPACECTTQAPPAPSLRTPCRPVSGCLAGGAGLWREERYSIHSPVINARIWSLDLLKGLVCFKKPHKSLLLVYGIPNEYHMATFI